MTVDKKKDSKLGQCEPPDRLAGGERFDYLARCAKDLGFSEQELKDLAALYGEQMPKDKS
ncbi:MULTISPECIES: hypothetical protein [unclassified Lentilitoribacter]|jgi:hypothetical protein|uniref:hypothetical protein n=1 Tax=unclassified Lentilitoribacter TaxID=2647570 RepID=UPI0013A6B0F2|nr:hypothetical protein [Lentilitoribacter sp. Alg239-R112]